MAAGEAVTSPPPNGHQRSRSAVIKSFVHRRQPSKTEVVTDPAPLEAQIDHVSALAYVHTPAQQAELHGGNMGGGDFAKNNPGALGEIQTNQQESAPRLGRTSRDDPPEHSRGRSRSPTKGGVFGNPFKPSSNRDPSKAPKSREASPTKSIKARGNLASFLSRPKSLKDLYKLALDEEARQSKDKENRTPDRTPDLAPPPPIFAQFTSDSSVRDQLRQGRSSADLGRQTSNQSSHSSSRPGVKERPKSFQVPPASPYGSSTPVWGSGSNYAAAGSGHGRTAGVEPVKAQRGGLMGALSSKGHSRTRSAGGSPGIEANDPVMNTEDIDMHLEAMLDRRNIPENQRYKMRNLNDTIKMEFIRQDWAEMQAAKTDRPGTTDSANSNDEGSAVAAGSDGETDKPKRTRGKSFTFSRGKKEPSSPTKKSKGDGTLGRHFRGKSAESIVGERPSSSSGQSSTTSLLSKIKLQQGPADYVAYLKKAQKPETTEVGKIHKLRLLLRNETVAWIEEFIQQGGMKEIVDLLKRIMAVEWREEHEDALLHENLLCLKALCTTARAMQYLHSTHADLFPKLLHLIFDPEKKGPSEFTTRSIITSILFTYIESASPAERVARAKNVLTRLRDPMPKDEERPLPFVLEMRQDRPYRVWNKEVVSVTKEVFWIFLHNLNVVALPSSKRTASSSASTLSTALPVPPSNDPHSAYMARHFPQERPPVPAAPYVGGVEWDATNYLASHLDLLNAILACTPTQQARNALRADLRISGWERCMGCSLRLCKEKFYGSVHDGLRTWVAAAAEDGWDVKDVRFGPPPDAKSPPKRAGGGQKSKVEEAPKIEMPGLDFGEERRGAAAVSAADAWIS